MTRRSRFHGNQVVLDTSAAYADAEDVQASLEPMPLRPHANQPSRGLRAVRREG